MKRFIAFFLFAISSNVSAELYRNISPLDTLGEVKARFPNANVERLIPAWGQEKDSMYQINGFGIIGVIIVKFNDHRPQDRRELEAEKDELTRLLIEKVASASDDEANVVEWVRWIPESSFPIQRLMSKYGIPEKSGFSETDYQPFRSWTKRGVHAFLTDDEKGVRMIDFYFTKKNIVVRIYLRADLFPCG